MGGQYLFSWKRSEKCTLAVFQFFHHSLGDQTFLQTCCMTHFGQAGSCSSTFRPLTHFIAFFDGLCIFDFWCYQTLSLGLSTLCLGSKLACPTAAVVTFQSSERDLHCWHKYCYFYAATPLYCYLLLCLLVYFNLRWSIRKIIADTKFHEKVELPPKFSLRPFSSPR